LFFLAHELKRPIEEILNMSVVEIRAWQEWFVWKNDEARRQSEKARRR
jgi:hypothetical protein